MPAPERFTITGCTVADGPALSANNMTAFWANPWWRLTWRHRTLEYHILQASKILTRNLLDNRKTMRHEKAIDPETGRLLGYARWYVPPAYATTADGAPVWPEGVVPGVDSEEEAEIRRLAEEAHWDPNTEPDVLDVTVDALRDEVLKDRTFMRLEYLAVHPDNQGKGIGTALVKSGLKQADKLGLDVFIQALEDGVNVYGRMGFEIQKEITQDDSMFGGTGRHYTCMMTYEQKKPQTDT
ncbi:hypothetical protein PG995_001890 [Apiospora arundinis]